MLILLLLALIFNALSHYLWNLLFPELIDVLFKQTFKLVFHFRLKTKRLLILLILIKVKDGPG
jgi:hypothetical protein